MNKSNRIFVSDVEGNKILNNLSERVDSLEKTYNPEGLNLHFDNPPSVDSSLFEKLLLIGQEAWNIVQNHKSRKTSYWFYDFFLLIGRASLNVLNDKSQNSIPSVVIEKLIILLVDIEQITTVEEYSGDITKRNYEALGNLLLAFDKNGDLQKLALKRADEINLPNVIAFTQETVRAVAEIRNKY